MKHLLQNKPWSRSPNLSILLVIKLKNITFILALFLRITCSHWNRYYKCLCKHIAHTFVCSHVCIHIFNVFLLVKTKAFVSEMEKQECNPQSLCSDYVVILMFTVLQQLEIMNVKKVIKRLPSLSLNIVENKLNLITTHISFETFLANF